MVHSWYLACAVGGVPAASFVAAAVSTVGVSTPYVIARGALSALAVARWVRNAMRLGVLFRFADYYMVQVKYRTIMPRACFIISCVRVVRRSLLLFAKTGLPSELALPSGLVPVLHPRPP